MKNTRLPLSLPQRDIYYEQLIYPDTPIYNIGAKIEIKGNVRLEALRIAYAELIRQHDTFRSVIGEEDGEPYMEVRCAYETQLEYYDFSTHEHPLAKAEAYMQEAFRVPFDLSAGKLLHRFCLIQVNPSLCYLFSVYHHIITDGWGTSLMFQRFTEFYNEVVAHGEVTHWYSHPYGDFTRASLQYYQSDAYQADVAYWQSRFSTLPGSLIPVKNGSATAAPALESARCSIALDRAVYDQLTTLSGAAGATTFHSILGVLYAYFARVYNNDDLAIGLPVLNRGGAAFKKTVGVFMGVMPFRVTVDYDIPFLAFLKQIKGNLMKDYRHSSLPLGQIIRSLGVGLEEKQSMFDVTLSYEKHDYAHAFDGAPTRVIPLSHGAERVALAIYVREFNAHEDVTIDFDYSTRHFDPNAISRLTGHFTAFLHAVIEDPSRKLKDMAFIGDEERRMLLDTFSDTARNYPADSTITDLVAEQSWLLPDKAALADRNSTYTFRQVEELSDQLAYYLCDACALEPHEPVAILFDRSALMVITMIGILKAGGAYVPLDPGFPAARLEYILEQSGARLLLTGTDARIHLDAAKQRGTIDLRKVQPQVNRYPKTGFPSRATPEGLSYILYTSGSTGKPKGVRITHRSVVNFLTSMLRTPGITAGDRLLAVTTYSFDISVLELFLPLISGAYVHVAAREVLDEPALLLGEMQKVSPTVMQATPSFWQMLFDSGWEGDKRLKVLCGGEPLGIATGERLLAANCQVWNMYGPTETTIWSTVKRLNTVRDLASIGKPIQNTDIYILDPWQALVPIGVVGEIYIGGDGVAQGYHDRPDLTAERFTPHFLKPGRQLYRTGDLGSWSPEGEIHFLGRKDGQVKVRGYRIEVAEVEHALMCLPHVKEAVVLARQDEKGHPYLVAYLVPAGPIHPRQITLQLQQVLPCYMIPSAYEEITAIPVTPNGKTDRKALSALGTASALAAAPGLPARTQLERQLVGLWQKLLNRESISIDDNFFSIGGHSLKATQLLSLIYKHFGVKLKLRTVFAFPTVEQLAAVISGEKVNPFEPIPIAPALPSYPLSPSQEQLWVVSQSEHASASYNMAAAFRIGGDVDANALQGALRDLIVRHESLRTVFYESAGKPVQKIMPSEAFAFKLEQFDLGSKNNAEVEQFIHAEISRPFVLHAGPLLRASLINAGEETRILLFAIHHIIADGWSIEVLVQETMAFYDARTQGGIPALPALTIQYKDYTCWLNAALTARALATHREYWLKKMADFRSATELPIDRPRSETQTCRGSVWQFELDKSETSGLRMLAEQEDATLFMALLSVVDTLIHRYTGLTDITLGSPVAGRAHPDLEHQVGLYVNTLLLRTVIEPRSCFKALLSNVKKGMLDAFEHQEYPFTLLADALKDVAGPRQPLFRMMIALQKSDSGLRTINASGNVSFQPILLPDGISRFDITFNFVEQPESVLCQIEYNTDLFLKESIVILSLKLKKLIGQILAAPGDAIEQYDINLDFEKKIEKQYNRDRT